MKRRIKIDFVDFWGQHDKTDNYFYRLLVNNYPIEIHPEPDFLFYSGFGNRHQEYDCIKICFIGENRRPDFNQCDYAFSFDYLDSPFHYRLPLYAMYGDPYQVIRPPDLDIDKIIAEKTGFCSFVVSNPNCLMRNTFFEKLSKYRKVNAGGALFNNVGGSVTDKLQFVGRHKFDIAFENSEFPGYTTEKIYEPMIVNTVPVYWGNSLVDRDFNPGSFINASNYKTLADLVDWVVEVDRNDALYKRYLLEPPYHNNQINEFVNPANVLRQFDFIFNNDKRPVARKKWSFVGKKLRALTNLSGQ